MRRFQKILFLADGSKREEIALARAAELANENDAKLTIFDAVADENFDPTDPILGQAVNELCQAHVVAREEELEALSQSARERHPSLSLSISVAFGSPPIAAIQAVISENYDLVVKAPQGGIQKLNMLFGGTDQKLMRKCPCPVWIVRPTDQPTFNSIVAAVEIDPNKPEAAPMATQIMELATSLAVSDDSTLHIVHAWHLAAEAKLNSGRIDKGLVERVVAEMGKTHEASLRTLVNKHPYEKMQAHVIKGEAGDVILDVVEEQDADLVVLGTVCRSGIPGLLIGNTAERVLSSVDCSVLTLKPSGFVTPIEA